MIRLLCFLIALIPAMVFAGQDEKVVSNGPVNWPQYYNGTSFHHPRIDSSTRAINTIDYTHHEIHAGNHFFLSGVFKDTGSGVTKTFGVNLPAGSKEAHMVFALSSNGEMEFRMYEGTSGSTFYNGGTGVTPLNSNRASSNTSILTIVGQPNHVASGVSTALFHNIHGQSGLNPQKPGTPGGGGREAEIIFAPGKKYLVIMTSGAADNDMNYTAEWYEHTPKTE